MLTKEWMNLTLAWAQMPALASAEPLPSKTDVLVRMADCLPSGPSACLQACSPAFYITEVQFWTYGTKWE